MMRILNHALLGAALAIVCLTHPACAATTALSNQKIAQWGDPLTPPQSRTDCIGYASGNWPWPAKGGWKTCNQWRTQWRHMEVEAYLKATGPDNVGNEVKNAVTQCVAAAAAGAVTAVAVTDGAAVPAALAAAKVTFFACMSTKGTDIGSEYSLTIDTPTHWTDWG